ncbi:IPT/TIG domain-containing protein [candidate division KSB1 bacterium]|nr:IPT/TIG domain-containing protein [candidate division KSB1 bacterium]
MFTKCTYIVILVLSILIISTGCEYDSPQEVWNPDQSAIPAPKIASVVPADMAVAGIDEIQILGENFPTNPDSVIVWFDTSRVPVASISATQLVVNRPAIVGDVTIKVVVPAALEIAKFSPYSIEEVSSVLGDLSSQRNVYSIAVDKSENIYVADRRAIKIMSPDGTTLDDYASPRINTFTQILAGPEGYIYFFEDDKTISRIDPASKDTEDFVKLAKNVSYGDFDADGNLYAGGGDGLYVVNTDLANRLVAYSKEYEILSVRVYDNAVYILAENDNEPKVGIWKNQINDATGTLGDNELVLDWAASEYADYAPTSITFTDNGDMIIGMGDHPNYPIIVYKDGALKPLYQNPDLLAPTCTQLVWGNAKYLYVNRGSNLEVVRLKMATNGAPYYGRE